MNLTVGKKKRIAIYLVIFELFIIFAVTYGILYKKEVVIIDPIWSSNYTFGASPSFNYFYEPKPSKRITGNKPIGAPYEPFIQSTQMLSMQVKTT